MSLVLIIPFITVFALPAPIARAENSSSGVGGKPAAGFSGVAATCEAGSGTEAPLPQVTQTGSPRPQPLTQLRQRAISLEALTTDDVPGFIETAKQQSRALLAGSKDAADLGAHRLHLARSLALAARGPLLAEASAQRKPLRLESAELFRAVARDSLSLRERAWANGELAEIYLDENRFDEATRLARRALAAAEKDSDLLAKLRFGRTLAFALDGAGNRPGAIRLLRSTAELGESLRRDRLGRIDPAAAAGAGPRREEEAFGLTTRRLVSMLLDEVEGLDEGLALPVDATVQTAQTTETLRQTRLAEVRDLVETQRSAEVEDYFQDACLAPSETSAASENTRSDLNRALIVYPLLLEDRVGLLAEIHGTLHYFRSPAGPDSVAKSAESLRRLIEKRTTRQFLRPATELYDALIRPLEGLINGEPSRGDRAPAAAFVVVADGALRTIPFAALYDNHAKQYLVDRLPVAHVPSMRLTQPGPIQRDAIRVLAAGLGEATGGFSALDNTEFEIEMLSERFPSRVLWGADFQIDALETEIRTRPYSIVHLATHGRVESNGEESFLLAHDGRLGLNRMTQMIQTTRFRQEQPLELLTLSACETAGGDGRAALGLAGVAVRAGARSALATLWPVNDEATVQLVDRFYKELMKPGQSRAGALRSAQQSIREQPRFQHPSYWAPFLMISNWL